MTKIGRMATEDQRGVAGSGLVPPEPPPELFPDEAVIWRRLVAEMPADWFGIESQPLLKEFCRHSAYADRLALDIAEVRKLGDEFRDGTMDLPTRLKSLAVTSKVLQDLLRAHRQQVHGMADLATKLRLTQQSRYQPTTAQAKSRGRPPAGAKPWEIEPMAAALADAGMRYSTDSDDTRQ